MASIRLRPLTFSYRFAEQVLNSRLNQRQEIERIVFDPSIDPALLSRPNFNRELANRFSRYNWQSQPLVASEDDEIGAKMDFLKDRVGVEVGFGHASFLGIDLLKFQVASYSGLDRIDVGVYIVTTRGFQRTMKDLGNNWEGSLTYEKVCKYLPYFKSAIQVPILVLGIDT